MKELYRLLGVKLAATTAYHPQGDGQMERVNQELEQFLCLFINQRQDDWDELLPIAEFQYNNHIHSATQNIPFLLDTGRIPRMGFEPDQRRSNLESVNEFKERMENASTLHSPIKSGRTPADYRRTTMVVQWTISGLPLEFR